VNPSWLFFIATVATGEPVYPKRRWSVAAPWFYLAVGVTGVVGFFDSPVTLWSL
jgi:hypothetical protein